MEQEIFDNGISQSFQIQLLMLVVFMMFTSALLEICKRIYNRFDKSNKGIKVETLWILQFAIALFACYAFDYGAMARIIQAGVKVRGSLAGWFDYFGTAALVSLGADWGYDFFAKQKAKLKAIKNKYEKANDPNPPG